MSTNSNIAKKNSDGTITSIYCHWDGYPSNNGRILLDHYNNESKIDELLSLGSISSLAKNVKPIGKTHSFDNKEPNCVVAYHRDRGEDLEITVLANLKEFKSTKHSREYNYLWDNGVWFVNGKKLTKKVINAPE